MANYVWMYVLYIWEWNANLKDSITALPVNKSFCYFPFKLIRNAGASNFHSHLNGNVFLVFIACYFFLTYFCSLKQLKIFGLLFQQSNYWKLKFLTSSTSAHDRKRKKQKWVEKWCKINDHNWDIKQKIIVNCMAI